MKKPFSILSLLFLILLTIPAVQAQEGLTQTLTAPDNSFSMMYPTGWTEARATSGTLSFIQFSSGLNFAYL